MAASISEIWLLSRSAVRIRLPSSVTATPDGDFVDVDWAGNPDSERLVVLFHGLEGGSGSHYARTMALEAAERGWRLAIPHFRGCSGALNRLPRGYHSGDSDELDWMLRTLGPKVEALLNA